MKAYEYLNRLYTERKANCPQWRYKGPGLGHGLLHVIGILDPHQVVTCSNAHGWLGTPEQFVKEFDLLPE